MAARYATAVVDREVVASKSPSKPVGRVLQIPTANHAYRMTGFRNAELTQATQPTNVGLPGGLTGTSSKLPFAEFGGKSRIREECYGGPLRAGPVGQRIGRTKPRMGLVLASQPELARYERRTNSRTCFKLAGWRKWYLCTAVSAMIGHKRQMAPLSSHRRAIATRLAISRR